MRHLFIVNPVAGKGEGIKYIDRINALSQNRDNYIVEITKGEGHATELVKQYASKDKYKIYAVGGDGTINEVVNGIIGSTSSLAIIPTGSGNDFVRTIYSKYNQEELLGELINGEEKPADLVSVNDKYFLNIASVGLDAEVALNVSQFKKNPLIPGNIAYLLSIFKTVINYRSHELKIIIDNSITIEQKVLLLAIANGKFYGGGIKIAPQAHITDSFFDVCIVEDLKLWKILMLLPRLLAGTHESLSEISFYKGKEIEIMGKKPFLLNIDGEIFKENNVHIRVIPQGINIVVPGKISNF